MAPIPVSIKHAGTKYDLELDPSLAPTAFKQLIYERTGVEPAKQKVLVKGGQLKDDADWSKLAIKPGHQFMVIGTAGELPKPPPQPVVFMEDMSDAELAKAMTSPAGLENLGNTCYLNSTVQVLKAIPELQTSLNAFSPTPSTSSSNFLTTSSLSSSGASGLTLSLRDLYRSLGSTQDAFPPFGFLDALRRFAPQFAERSQHGAGGGGGGYSQQDAEECWTQIVGAVRNTLDLPKTAATTIGEGSGAASAGGSVGAEKFVDRYMTGELTTETKCTETEEEPTTTSKEAWLELKCNISINTNYMMTGIKDALDEQPLEKRSTVLGRDAVFSQTSRISRLPSYLTVHMVRFYWRRDINKKTKIMRKVKFPFDLDLLDLLTPSLAKSVGPVAEKMKEVDKDRRERAKVRRRARVAKEEADQAGKVAALKAKMTTQAPPTNGASTTTTTGEMAVDPPEVVPGGSEEASKKKSEAQEAMDVDAALPDETTARAKERQELEALVDPELKRDKGANVTGQYELVGIVTHKGASADGGHYLGWVRRDVATAPTGEAAGGPAATETAFEDPDKQEWYRFDDDKVSIVPREKITTLDGGGEDSVAYLLLYKSKPF